MNGPRKARIANDFTGSGSQAMSEEDALPAIARESMLESSSKPHQPFPSESDFEFNEVSRGHLFSPHDRLNSNFFPKHEKEIIPKGMDLHLPVSRGG